MKEERNSGKSELKVILRYSLFQIPAILIIILIYFLLTMFFLVKLNILIYVLCGWIIKDIIIYPFVWRAYKVEKIPVSGLKLVGKRGIVVRDLDPEGYIKISGELWKAVADGQIGFVQKGRSVIIKKVDGLMVWVTPEAQNREKS